MNKQDEHKEPDKLKDLLDKAKAGGMDAADDFEKEALEGFDQLESEEEAYELKALLDAKIDRELFSKATGRATPLYWMAAAGLLLVIGLSVFFILQNTEKEATKLAITETKPGQTEHLEPAKAPEIVATEQPKESIKLVKPEQKQAAKAPMVSDEVQDMNNRASGAGSNDQENAMAAAPVEEPRKQQEEPASTKADDLVLEDSREGSKIQEDKKVAEEAEISAAESKKSKSLKMAAASPKPTVNAGLDHVVTQQNAAPISNYSYSGAGQNNSSGTLSNTMPAATTYTINACHYKGGKKALLKELKEILEAKHLSKAFEVRLKINAAKAVEKVEFINAGKLSPEEKEGIEAILKKLDKFYFDLALKTGEFLPYDLKYKP